MRLRWWLVAILGVLYVISAWAMSAARQSAGTQLNFIVGGALILSGGLWMALAPEAGRWRAIVLALLGIWMAISPWTFHFQKHSKDLPATLAAGILVLLCAVLTFFLPDDARLGASHRRSA